MKEFLQEHLLTILTTIFGGGSLFGWISERKKRLAETQTIETENQTKELDNSQKIVTLYKDTLDDLNKRYEEKYVEVCELYEKKIQHLQDEIRYHKTIISNLKKEILELKKKIKELTK